MSLPPGFLDELRERLALSDVVGRKVSWDARKSNAAKGDFWAPCPFHQEKTPSFHVDDRKGFYYCFGCHAKGDMITFVKDTENVSFIEAVEILAREAGVEMPARVNDPRAAEQRDRAARQIEAMEQAVRAFGLAFRSAAGTAARDYARSRGLSEETLKRFEIGFAPDGRTHLTEAFRSKDALDDAIAAGLVIRPDDGGAPYDRFRNRLIFPIRDPRGRCIAFGGRAMDPQARAKYLNSPETELFHKGRTLYNHGPAREAAGKAGGLIVAEGYMDVIALAQAGLPHAVAPLGTAITEEQLGLMWRITDEPVMALDGDAAGRQAAERLIDLALPLLAPGKSLRFCLLPAGRDPDDLIRTEGVAAMKAALDGAIPLVEMLWRRETAEPLDTPERRAALDQRLKGLLAQIADVPVRNHYAAELRARRAQLFRPAPKQGSDRPVPGRHQPRGAGHRPRAGPTRPARETLGSDLARRTAGQDAEARIRESAILAVALANPAAAAELEESLEAMTFRGQETAAIRDALVDALTHGGDLVAVIAEATGADPIAALHRVPQARAHPMARPGADPAAAILVLGEAIRLHEAALAHELEVRDACHEIAEAEDESLSARVEQANRMRREAPAVGLRSQSAEERDSAIHPRGDIHRLINEAAWEGRAKKS